MILDRLLLAAVPFAPSPTPSPTPTDDLTPSQAAAPGVWAFVAFLFLVVALWLLMRNMNARLRRMSYKQKAAERDAASPQVGTPTPASAGAEPEVAGGPGSDAVVERDGRGDVVGDEREDR
jgi:flagellar biosynthesis/type III secretory pathway M-ring protein FliF/YscJ